MKKTLIIMTRVPYPGQTKTRMMPFLTENECANFHMACLQDISNLQRKILISTNVFFTGNITEEFKAIFPPETKFFPQKGDSLGERMANAFQVALHENSHVIMIGSDLPHLTPHLLKRAFLELNSNDLVLGPALDGGYYLIGLKKFYPELFTNIKWSTDQVLQETLKKAKTLGLKYYLLKPLMDLDTPEDLKNFFKKTEYCDSNTWKYLRKIFETKNKGAI